MCSPIVILSAIDDSVAMELHQHKRKTLGLHLTISIAPEFGKVFYGFGGGGGGGGGGYMISPLGCGSPIPEPESVVPIDPD